MLPVLQVGPLVLQTYPLALLLAVWLTLTVGGRGAKRQGIQDDHVYNGGLYALIAGVAVARLAHVITYWQAYRTQPLEIFGFNTQAFILWPGVIAGMAMFGWYVRRHRLPLAAMLDALAPGILVGLAVASLGALLAGQASGAPSEVPWAIGLWGVQRHPSQVYESVALLLGAGLAWSALRRAGGSGTAALVALLAWGLTRWLLEPFRAESTTILGGLRMAQVVGLAAAVAALWALRRRSTGEAGPQPES